MDNISHLKQLVALADTSNYRKAGEKLGVSHSAVSQTISKLESFYGVNLFYRRKNETVPTIFGQRIIESARSILNEVEQVSRDIKLMRNLEGGKLVLGADPNICEGLLAPALGRLMNSHPNLKFSVEMCSWSKAERRLVERQLDLYIGLKPNNLISVIDYKDIKLSPPIVACNSKHKLSKKIKLSIEELIKFPLIGGDVPDWFLEKIVNAYPESFECIDSLRSIFLTTQDQSLLRKLLLSTEAVAMLPKSLISDDINNGTLVQLEINNFPFKESLPAIVASLDGYPQPPSAKKLILEIENILRK